MKARKNSVVGTVLVLRSTSGQPKIDVLWRQGKQNLTFFLRRVDKSNIFLRQGGRN